MKKVFSILFIVGAIVGAVMGSLEATAVSLTGLAIAQSYGSKLFTGVAFLQIVPGKYTVMTPSGLKEVPYMSRAQQALYDQLITLRRANPVTEKVIAEGGVSFDPISYYVRYTITGLSGRQQLINSSTIPFVGVTNIPNNGAMPQFYNFCFDRIAVRYAVTASAAANAAAVTGFSSIRGSMPAALGNGHLIINSNSNKILETPVSDFTSVAAITGGGERDYDGGVLEKPRFFLELINIEVELAFATGQTVPSAANNTYTVEVMFYGVQARLKA